MRIVLVNKYTMVTGGADRHCLDLADLLRERGHQIRFMSFVGERDPRITGAFVTPTVTHETRDRMSASQRLVVAMRSLWNRAAAGAMYRLIGEFQPDVVHAHKLYPQLSVAPVVIAHNAGIPVLQTAHDHEFIAAHPEDDRGGRVDRRESALQYRALNTAIFPVRRLVHAPRVARWIAPSRSLASIYARHAITCEVLQNFVVDTGTGQLDYESRRGLTFTARLTEAKGARDVLDLARRAPQLDITIAGAGPLSHEVEASASSLPNLRYAGFVDQPAVRRLVRESRLVVMPSRCAEAAPLAALEAMEAGTPSVVYASGGLAEYVADAGAGLVVPQDPESLALASLRVHDDPDLWRKLSHRAVAAARGIHAPERYIVRLENVYRDLLSGEVAGNRNHDLIESAGSSRGEP